MDESRLLTPAELQKLLIGMKAGEFYPNYIAKAQDTKTLKEVGEDVIEPILNFYIEGEKNKQFALDVWQQFKGLALKSGELPKE